VRFAGAETAERRLTHHTRLTILLLEVFMSRFSAAELAATTPEELAEMMAGPPALFAPWAQSAAEHGMVEAQFLYAQMLLDGSGVPQDQEAALEWFKRAAELGHVKAMDMVGSCYENGWGAAPDDGIALHWFRMAADHDYDWAMYHYATMLEAGRGGVEPDHAAALALYRKAGGLGHAQSMTMVGRYLESGTVMAADVDAAMACYHVAAEGGDYRGMFHYGRMLVIRGQINEALPWLKQVQWTAPPSFMQTARQLLFATGEPLLMKLYDAPEE
jgi:TPR repeat protein